MSRTSGGRRDWLPSNRAARVAMARVWIDVFVERGHLGQYSEFKSAVIP